MIQQLGRQATDGALCARRFLDSLTANSLPVSRRTMLSLSRALEDAADSLGESTRLLAGFQEIGRFAPQCTRYERLRRRGVDVAIWASASGAPRRGVRPLTDEDALKHCWFVLVIADCFSAGLFGVEHEGEFRAAVLLDSELVRLVALAVEDGELEPIDYSSEDPAQRFIESLTTAFHVELTSARRGLAGRQRFVEFVVHDLRQPLTFASGMLELLEARLPAGTPPTLAADLRAIRNATDRSVGLAADMLDTSRLRDGRLTPKLEEFALEPFLEEVVEAATPSAQKAGIAIRRNRSPLRGVADRELIRRAVLNLIDNAIRFSPTGGVIRLVARRRAHGMISLAVADQGRGFQRDRDNPQVRDCDRDGRLTGFGLGLAFCNEVTAAHGGELRVISAPGWSAAVEILLPQS
jgi:signal transduction histidine kinase